MARYPEEMKEAIIQKMMPSASASWYGALYSFAVVLAGCAVAQTRPSTPSGAGGDNRSKISLRYGQRLRLTSTPDTGSKVLGQGTDWHGFLPLHKNMAFSPGFPVDRLYRNRHRLVACRAAIAAALTNFGTSGFPWRSNTPECSLAPVTCWRKPE